MKEVLTKLTSYNLFNYLFPGIVFVVVLNEITRFNLIQESNLLGIFIYYFIGLCISRFGSLIIGPVLKKIKFIKFTDYSEYIYASDVDNKLELFSEINNVYRTIISTLTLVLMTKLYEIVSVKLSWINSTALTVLIIALLILFIFAYKKQTGFIVSRVNTRNQNPKV